MKKIAITVIALNVVLLGLVGCSSTGVKKDKNSKIAATSSSAIVVSTKAAVDVKTTTGAVVTASALKSTTTTATAITSPTAVTPKATTDAAVNSNAVAVQGKVLKSIGSETITEEELNAEVENLPPQYKAFYSSPDGKQKLLDNLVTRKILKIVALKDGIDKDADYLKEIEKVKEQVLANYAVKRNIIDKVKASDEELKAEFDKRKETYKTGEEVKASHILIKFPEGANDEDKAKLKAKAEGILKDALADKDFAELAKNNSEDGSAEAGGSLGWFGKGRMVPQFEEASFKGEKGKVYPTIVETQFGYHIIKVDDKKEPGYKSFDEVKDQLKEEMNNVKLRQEYEKWMDGLKKEYIK